MKPGELYNKKVKQRKVDNKMHGYGDFDEATGQIRINKKRAKKDPMHKRPIKKGAKKYPEVLDSIVHEEFHKRNPKATEKKTYKATKKIVKKLTPKAKKKLYGRYA